MMNFKPKLQSGPSVLLVICLTGLAQLSETIYTPALVNMAQSLQISESMAQWTLSIYFAGFALGVLFWGRLSDYIGRRPAMHTGYITYIAASLACTLSLNIGMVMIARFTQAFGASVGSVITQSVLRDCFSGNERHKLFSVVGYALGLAPVLGPLIGGFLVQWYDWSANLLLLAVLGAGLVSYSWLRLPETRVMAPLETVSISLTDVFKSMLKDPYVLTSAFLVSAFNGLLFSYYAEAPFIFIDRLGLTPGFYGMLGIVIAAGYFMGSALSYYLNDYYSTHKLIGLGCFISFTGCALLTIVSMSGLITPAHIIVSTMLVLSSMFFVFVAFSLAIPNILSTALSDYSHITGTASSIFGFIYYALIGVWTMLMGYLHADKTTVMPVYFLAITLSMLIIDHVRQFIISQRQTAETVI